MYVVEDFVRRVQDHVRLTDSLLDSIRPSCKVSHPIPFFGRIDKATALTVAMNPSATEFEPARNWPLTLSSADLSNRLLGYFSTTSTPSHSWFSGAERPLRSIGLRYQSNLAHVDVVPRATRTISNEDVPAFLGVADADAWVLFEALSLAKFARLAVLAGTVTKKYYLDEWVAIKAPNYGWELITEEPLGCPGYSFHQLRNQTGREIHVFFSSVGPHRRGFRRYGAKVIQASDRLRKIIS